MTAGDDRRLPDFMGGDEPDAQREGFFEDPYATSASASDPYGAPASDPFGSSDGFGSSDRYGVTDPYASSAHGPHGQAPMGPPAHGGFARPPESSNSAIAGLVLGILALSVCSGLTAPFGIFFALLGMRETAPTAISPKGGRGLAIAGLVCSLVGLLPLLLICFWVVLMILGAVLSGTA